MGGEAYYEYGGLRGVPRAFLMESFTVTGWERRRHHLPKLTQEETDGLNRPLCIKEIESRINNLAK